MFDLDIRTKILILAFLPLLIVGYFTFLEVQNKRDIVANAEKVDELTKFSTTISAMVHELQKERGRTGLFMGSAGGAFEKELAEQRALTDEKRNNWEKFYRDFIPEKFGVRFVDKFTVTVSKLNELDKHREGVLSLYFSSQEGIDFYTALNGLIVDSVFEVSRVNTDQKFVALIEAYASFLRGKELAGVERATGSRIFSEDKFNEGDYNRFFQLIVLQDAYFNSFANFASREQIDFFGEAMEEMPFIKTKEMRNTLLATPPDGGNFGVSPGDWFDLMTEKIDLLKETEDKMVDDLIKTSDEVKKQAQKDLMLFLSTITIISILVLVLVILLTRSFYRRLGSMDEKVAEIVEKNNFNLRFSVEADDEIGNISAAFNNMLERLETVKQSLKEEESRYMKLISSLEKELRGKSKDFEKLRKEQQEVIVARTTGMEEKIKELEMFKRLSFGRELRILELKKEIESLKHKK